MIQLQAFLYYVPCLMWRLMSDKSGKGTHTNSFYSSFSYLFSSPFPVFRIAVHFPLLLSLRGDRLWIREGIRYETKIPFPVPLSPSLFSMMPIHSILISSFPYSCIPIFSRDSDSFLRWERRGEREGGGRERGRWEGKGISLFLKIFSRNKWIRRYHTCVFMSSIMNYSWSEVDRRNLKFRGEVN